MTKLFCVVVRVGDVFPVDIDLSETEGDRWPDSRDEAIKALTAESTPDRIKHLMQKDLLLYPTSCLNDDKCFGTNFERANDDVHVLVDYPDAGQVLKYVYYKHIEQDGFLDTFVDTVDFLVENVRSWNLSWSSLCAVEKRNVLKPYYSRCSYCRVAIYF